MKPLADRWLVGALVMCLCETAAHADEFFGPFPSWLDVKRECGAAGDGKADDTAALQKGLETIRNPDSPKRVLYLPAGTYRITGMLKLIRESHTQSQGVGVVGAPNKDRGHRTGADQPAPVEFHNFTGKVLAGYSKSRRQYELLNGALASPPTHRTRAGYPGAGRLRGRRGRSGG